MQRIYRWLRFAGGQGLFLLSLLLVSLAFFTFPAILHPYKASQGWWMPYRYELKPALWWQEFAGHLAHIAHGHLLPPWDSARPHNPWLNLPANLLQAGTVTFALIGVALVVSLMAGALLGWSMTRFAPPWLRRFTRGLTMFFSSMPDLIIAIGLDVGLVLIASAFHRNWAGNQLPLYQHFLAPVLALTLLVAPYVANVTAVAIGSVAGELFVRAVVAKGVPPHLIALKHIGRNVAAQVWTTLPVIVSMLISADAIVEYAMELPGIGRALVLLLSGKLQLYPNSYAAFLFLLPLLAFYVIASTLQYTGLTLLDPRIGSGGAFTDDRTGYTAPKARRKPLVQRLKSAVRSFRLAPRERVAQSDRWRRIARALKDPVLLVGALFVLGLLFLALFPGLVAPYDPNFRFQAYTDAHGQIFTPPFLPSRAHPLGTDYFGRDMLSRIIYGTRYALMIAAVVVPVRFLLAFGLAFAAAWRRGLWRRMLDGLAILATTIPVAVVALVLVRTVNMVTNGNARPATVAGLILVALVGVPKLAKSMQLQIESALTEPCLEGAQAVGASTLRMVTRYIFPRLSPQLLAMAVLEIPMVMTLAATLAFFNNPVGGWVWDQDEFHPLSTGEPANPEWGAMLYQPLVVMLSGQWWLWAPFCALFLAVLAFHLLGEGLQRRLRKPGEWRWTLG